ncbi:hypothetical protein QYF36_006947 [Acer negundo]|nr:hypothetical protein QYF36_006947 [Acer negundo]
MSSFTNEDVWPTSWMKRGCVASLVILTILSAASGCNHSILPHHGTVRRLPLVCCRLQDEVFGDPNVSTALVDASHYADYRISQIAERALKHIDKIPNFFGIFPNMGSANAAASV